ncbi:MAG: hypothetical protein JWP30_1748 [Homoserinimonas sp.]|nr:hypothetical protein [Homoserinimonas sp.]
MTGIPGYLSMADTLQLAYDQMGLGTYSNASLAASLGVAAVIMQVTLWVLTLAVSVRRLKRGRLAWWIPVVGGAVAVMVLLFIVTVAITGDPTFAASLRG